jgi:hypothetical protein
MRMVFTLLTERPGSDFFSFYIPDGPRQIRIDFPNKTTKYTAYLEQQLALAGVTGVRVD